MPSDEEADRLDAEADQLVQCGSLQEFRLKAEVLGWSFPYSFDQFQTLIDKIEDKDLAGFAAVIGEAVKKGYFDPAFDEVEFFQDYYIARAVDPDVDETQYARYKAVELLATSFSFNRLIRWSKTRGAAADMAYDVLKRIRRKHGDSPILRNAEALFRKYASRRD